MRALLIIPAYNEEENIEKVVARIDEFRKGGCGGLTLDYVIIKLFARCRVTDPTSGFRAANRKVIKYLARNYPVDYPEPESLVDLSKRSFRISEVQVNMLEREGGMSSISSWKSVYYMVKVSLAIVCSSLQKKTRED